MVELNAAMDQFRDLERGVLRLSVVSTANYFLPDLIVRFNQLHPGVRISLRVVNRDAVLATLADNLADLAITGAPPDNAEIVAEYFKDNPLVVVAAPDHSLAKRQSVALGGLEDETLLLREQGSGTRAAVERHFAEHKATFRPGCELSSNEAVKLAVQAGLGLGVVPAQSIELELQTKRLVVLPVESFPLVRKWFLSHRRDRRLSGAAQAFKSLLLGRIA